MSAPFRPLICLLCPGPPASALMCGWQATSCSVVMGVMLPLGVSLVGKKDEAIVPWAWGINGGMSVIGTVGATIIAINAGFTATFLVGAVLYVAAGTTGWWLDRSANS